MIGSLVQIVQVTPHMSYSISKTGYEGEYTGVLIEHKGQIGIVVDFGLVQGFDDDYRDGYEAPLVNWYMVYIQDTMDYVFAEKCELELL